MSRTLTVRTIDSIKPGPARQEIRDRYLPGLYLIVQPSGHRSWAVRYRSGGRSRKHTLGPYPALDLKTARVLASKALRAVAEDRDPRREKAQARASQPDTVETVVRLFIERHCLRVNRPRTIAETQRLFNRHVLPRWRSRLLRDITRRDVLDLLDRIVDAGAPKHDVPFGRTALDTLASLPRTGDFVLGATGARPASDYAQRKRRLDALLPADMPPWRLHDLRRTTASGMARLGVNLPTIERLLNHVSGSFRGIVGVYQRHDFAQEKKDAAELWACHVLALTQQPKQRRQPKRNNVVELAARS